MIHLLTEFVHVFFKKRHIFELFVCFESKDSTFISKMSNLVKAKSPNVFTAICKKVRPSNVILFVSFPFNRIIDNERCYTVAVFFPFSTTDAVVCLGTNLSITVVVRVNASLPNLIHISVNAGVFLFFTLH